MVQIENLPLVLTGLGLTASVLYYTMVLRNANKTQQQQLETRQAQLFMQIYNKFSESDFMEKYEIVMRKVTYESYEDYVEKYINKNQMNENIMVGSLLTYFEGIGVLLEDGLVDPEKIVRLL